MNSTIHTSHRPRLRVQRRPEVDLDKLVIALLRLAREDPHREEPGRG